MEFIGSFAFKNCSSLTSLIIPGNIKNFGRNIFEGCINLEKLVFKSNPPENLVSVLRGFDFNSVEVNGDEVTFVREVENEKEE